MRVLFLSAMNPYPPISGGQKVAYALLKLYAQRADVHLIHFYEQSQPEIPDLLACELGDLCAHMDAVPLTIHYGLHRYQQLLKAVESIFSPYPFRVQKFWSPAMKKLVSHVAQTGTFDLVHCEYLHMSRYLSCFQAVPVILEEQNIEWEIFERHSRYGSHWGTRLFSWFEARRLRQYEVQIANRCTHILALSERDKGQLEEAGVSSPISVLPFPVEPDPIASFNSESPSIISLGNLSAPGREQGTLWFHSKVWPQIRSAIPGIRWHIVGANPSPQIRKIHDGENIWVHGFVETEALSQLLRQVQACIIPLFIGSGVRIKILEMMGLGIPCVSTSVGAQGIETDSVLVSDSPHDFAEKVIRQLTDSELWHHISLQGLDYVRRYHSQLVLEAKFEAMLTQVLKRREAKV